MNEKNTVRIEGTMKNVPKVWTLKDGRKRASFTLRTRRENGKYDYIDCCAYNEMAEIIAKRTVPGEPVRIHGWLMTYIKPGMEYKRTMLVVEVFAKVAAGAYEA